MNTKQYPVTRTEAEWRFEDHYGTALKELVQEKMKGHTVVAKEAERPSGKGILAATRQWQLNLFMTNIVLTSGLRLVAGALICLI